MASGRASNPQTWNRYAYTLNNPLRFIDPYGLEEQPCATTDQECAKRRQGSHGKGHVTVTGGITVLEPVTSDSQQAQKQQISVTPSQQKKMVAVVYSEKTTATVKEAEAIGSVILNRANSGDKQYVEKGKDVNIDNVITKTQFLGVDSDLYKAVIKGTVAPQAAETGVANVVKGGATTDGTFFILNPGGKTPTSDQVGRLGDVTPATPAQAGDVYLYIPSED